jgi:hypothetical protein
MHSEPEMDGFLDEVRKSVLARREMKRDVLLLHTGRQQLETSELAHCRRPSIPLELLPRTSRTRCSGHGTKDERMVQYLREVVSTGSGKYSPAERELKASVGIPHPVRIVSETSLRAINLTRTFDQERRVDNPIDYGHRDLNRRLERP